MNNPRRVLFDGEAFARHRRSGITRYFAEMIGQFRADPSLGVEPVTPYRYIANEHLKETAPDRFRQVPLPGRWREQLLAKANAHAMRAAEPADLVHYSLYEPSALETWQAPRTVCTVYDFTYELRPDLFPGTGPALVDKQLFLDRCDALLCISQTTYDDLRTVHPNIDKPVFVTPLGVSDAFFAPKTARIRGLPERYLLHVGNRYVHKNVDVLFQAFAEVAKADPSLFLVLSGNNLPEEPARLAELGIADRTIALKATDAQLPWLYRQAEAFVFPSLYEGFGLPVLEAMAASCPTIIANVPALLEVAGETAMVFEPHDVPMLIEDIHRMLGDRQVRDKFGEAGARRAREFTWRRTAEATSLAYDLAARA